MLPLLRQALQHGFRLRCPFRATNEAAAEDTRGIAVVRIEHAGLTRCDAAFAIDELDPCIATLVMQDSRARRAGGTDLRIDFDPTFRNIRQGAVAEPVDIA